MFAWFSASSHLSVALCCRYLGHLTERLGKYLLTTFLPTLKGLAQKYAKRSKKGEDVTAVVTQLLREVPQYRDIMMPDDEGVTVLDQHVKEATARIPNLESLIEHTLQFRSMLISADQGNTVDINLNVPATRDFLHRVLVDVAEELAEDPAGTWLQARPQELRQTVLGAVKNSVDGYLPYIRKQLDAGVEVTAPENELAPAGEPLPGAEESPVADEGKGEAQQMTIKVSKGAAAKTNPKTEGSGDEAAADDDDDKFEDEDEDDEF